MQERTLEQERKGLKQEVHDYLCLSAAKKLSKTITFLDKKWSNTTLHTLMQFSTNLYQLTPTSSTVQLTAAINVMEHHTSTVTITLQLWTSHYS